METQWLQDQVSAGLQRLVCLGLDRTPAAELLPLTLTVWIEALNHERSWDRARDEQRVKDAFSTLCRTVTQWPQPQHLMTALPPVTQQALTHKLPEVDPTHRPKAWDEIAKALRMPSPQSKSEDKPKRESIDVDAVERQLREHYADAKTRAAGDAE